MNNTEKIVTKIPLDNLWNDNEEIYASREKYLTEEGIKEIFKKSPVEFVIANVGDKLKWISYEKSFAFFKSKLKNRIANDINNIHLEDYEGNYVYVASEWSGEIEAPIILLEKMH